MEKVIAFSWHVMGAFPTPSDNDNDYHSYVNNDNHFYLERIELFLGMSPKNTPRKTGARRAHPSRNESRGR